MESWAELRTISQPGQVEQALRAVRRPAGTGRPVARPGARVPARRARRGLLHVDPVRGHAHEHVGPGAGAQLALPPRVEPLGRGVGQVVGERGDLEVEVVLEVVGLGHDPAQPRLGHQVVGAVHDSRSPMRNSADLGHVVREPADQRLGVVGQRGPVAVADGQVLGPDRRAVGGLPTKAVLVDRRGHAPPDHGVRRSRPAGGSGASGRCGRTCRAGSPRSMTPPKAAPRPMPICRLRTIVSPETRNSSIRMYQGPMVSRPGGGQGPEAVLGLRADLEVVVDHGHLAVEQEAGVGGVALHQGEQVVEQRRPGAGGRSGRARTTPGPSGCAERWRSGGRS